MTYALASAFTMTAHAHTKATGTAEWRVPASLVILVKLPGIHRATVLVAVVGGGGGCGTGIGAGS